MPTPRQAHRAATGVLSLVMIAIGVAMLATTFARVGLELALGHLLGVLFIALGAGRLYLQRRAPDA